MPKKKKDQLLDIWKTLPPEIIEKILLSLPYEKVKFITKTSFWRKKLLLDFKVDNNEHPKEIYDNLLIAISLIFCEYDGGGWGSEKEYLTMFDKLKQILWLDTKISIKDVNVPGYYEWDLVDRYEKWTKTSIPFLLFKIMLKNMVRGVNDGEEWIEYSQRLIMLAKIARYFKSDHMKLFKKAVKELEYVYDNYNTRLKRKLLKIIKGN
jgi:hypothetical protein